MPSDNDGYLIPVIVYVTSVLVGVWTWSWRLSGIKSAVERKIDALERVVVEKEAALKSEIVRADDEAKREFGESLAALRQKCHDLELYAERTFVDREDYRATMDVLTRTVDSLRAEINAGYHGKLDRILKEQK